VIVNSNALRPFRDSSLRFQHLGVQKLCANLMSASCSAVEWM
jgi:hypothetical protein